MEKIKIYASTFCGHCRALKIFLKEKNVPFEMIEINSLEKEKQEKILEELKKINPNLTVPTAVVGNKVIIGFNRENWNKVIYM